MRYSGCTFNLIWFCCSGRRCRRSCRRGTRLCVEFKYIRRNRFSICQVGIHPGFIPGEKNLAWSTSTFQCSSHKTRGHNFRHRICNLFLCLIYSLVTYSFAQKDFLFCWLLGQLSFPFVRVDLFTVLLATVTHFSSLQYIWNTPNLIIPKAFTETVRKRNSPLRKFSANLLLFTRITISYELLRVSCNFLVTMSGALCFSETLRGMVQGSCYRFVIHC